MGAEEIGAVVVVGAGQAAQSMIETLRKEGWRGAITLVGAEAARPYQRPPLSKGYLLGETARDRLFFRSEAFYEEAEVALRLGVVAEAIDPAARTVRLSTGETLAYDRLALTLGASPKRLPAAIGGGLGGVHVVRSLADVDAMATEMAPGRRALIVGGGYIGLEAAAVTVGLGLETTLVEAAPRILGRVAVAETAHYFERLHRDRGVTLLCGVGVSRLEPGADGTRVAQAELTDGRVLPADLVIVGVGVAPETALAEAAGLAIDDGIAVDGFGATSDPSIYAAGDCASFPHEGRRMRLESVQNAIDQAALAARAMLGAAEAAYAPVPWFWSDQYDVKLQIAGLCQGADDVVMRQGAREGALSVWSFAGGALRSVDAMNDPKAYMIGKRWLEAGVSPDPARLADPESDLRALA